MIAEAVPVLGESLVRIGTVRAVEDQKGRLFVF